MLKNSVLASLFVFALLCFTSVNAYAATVGIDENSLTCGSQTLEFSGTSTEFNPDLNGILVSVQKVPWTEGQQTQTDNVMLYNGDSYNSTDTNGTWVFPQTYTFGPGTYYVAASIVECEGAKETWEYGTTCTDTADETDYDYWEFTITACPNNDVTFHKDKRCHNFKPEIPSWSTYDASTSTLNWSATGGDKVEVKFGWGALELPYTLKLSNDGHEKVGVGTVAGWWGGYWKIRTINGCHTSDWSQIYSF